MQLVTILKHIRFSEVTEAQRSTITTLMQESVKNKINDHSYIRQAFYRNKLLRAVSSEPNAPWVMLMAVNDMLIDELEPLGLDNIDIDAEFYPAPHGRLLSNFKISANDAKLCEVIYETLEQTTSVTPDSLGETFQQLLAERDDGIRTYLTAVCSVMDTDAFESARHYLVQDIRQIIVGAVPLFDVMAALSVDLELTEDRKLHLKMRMRPRANKGEFFVDVSITIQL